MARRNMVSGTVLVLHGLAHALPAMQLAAGAYTPLLRQLGIGEAPILWAATLLSSLAMTGFVAAGFGCLGAAAFRRHWHRVARAAAVASLGLLLFWPTVWTIPGLIIDLAVLVRIPRANARLRRPIDSSHALATSSGGDRMTVRRLLHGAGNVLAVAFVAWIALITLTAPWHTRWGSTAAELRADLPGDEPLAGAPTFQIQHAITIAAPSSAVWPWLAQLGTDRGGFYSYEWLENLFGIPVHNADRIHPEWQQIATGDFIAATPRGYLGFDRPLGWKLLLVEPERVMVLENWGAFVLVPVDTATTRFIVRTRNGQPATLAGITFAWPGLLAFEPAHFLMQRRMMLGVKARAERAHRSAALLDRAEEGPQVRRTDIDEAVRGELS